MSTVWRVTIRLAGVMPTVWRTILVRPDTKLAMFHRYVQAAMGWRNYHLYAFTIEGKEYGIPSREHDGGRKIYDARRYTLERLFPSIPAGCDYVYDFGDWWEHTIVIEGAEDAVYRKQYPICVDGAEPCPPEDSGGPPGFAELSVILRDPDHPRYLELVGWARSQGYYLDGFSAQLATWDLRYARRGWT